MTAIPDKIAAGARSVRTFLRRPEVRRWIVPYRKPLAGFVTTTLFYLADRLHVVGLADYLPVAAGAIVAYFIPEWLTEPGDVAFDPDGEYPGPPWPEGFVPLEGQPQVGLTDEPPRFEPARDEQLVDEETPEQRDAREDGSVL